MADEANLTDKQKRVHDMLKDGASIGDVAKAIKTSKQAVYGHVRALKNKGYLDPNWDPPGGGNGSTARRGRRGGRRGRSQSQRAAATRSQIRSESASVTAVQGNGTVRDISTQRDVTERAVGEAKHDAEGTRDNLSKLLALSERRIEEIDSEQAALTEEREVRSQETRDLKDRISAAEDAVAALSRV